MKKNCVFLHQYEIDNSAAQASAGDISLREYQQSGSERRSRTMNRLLRTTAEPPEGVAFLFGYVSILLGIEPTWSAAKRSMFKQLQPLLKFMHEVDPWCIPIRRLRKAHKLFEAYLRSLLPEQLGSVVEPALTLFKWITSFEEVAELLLQRLNMDTTDETRASMDTFSACSGQFQTNSNELLSNGPEGIDRDTDTDTIETSVFFEELATMDISAPSSKLTVNQPTTTTIPSTAMDEHSSHLSIKSDLSQSTSATLPFSHHLLSSTVNSDFDSAEGNAVTFDSAEGNAVTFVAAGSASRESEAQPAYLPTAVVKPMVGTSGHSTVHAPEDTQPHLRLSTVTSLRASESSTSCPPPHDTLLPVSAHHISLNTNDHEHNIHPSAAAPSTRGIPSRGITTVDSSSAKNVKLVSTYRFGEALEDDLHWLLDHKQTGKIVHEMRSFAEKLGSLYDIDAFNKLQDKRSDALVELFLHVGEDEVQWVLLALDKMVSARTAYRDKLIEMSFLEILTEKFSMDTLMSASTVRSLARLLHSVCFQSPFLLGSELSVIASLVVDLMHSTVRQRGVLIGSKGVLHNAKGVLSWFQDMETIRLSCALLAHISNGGERCIECLLAVPAIWRVIKLAEYSDPKIQTISLRTVGNLLSGSETQTQLMLDNDALTILQKLLNSKFESIVIGACLAISNITAGSPPQIQMVLNSSVMDQVSVLLKFPIIELQREAAWVICNALVSGTSAQVVSMVRNPTLLMAVFQMLVADDGHLISTGIKGLGGIFTVAQVTKDVDKLAEILRALNSTFDCTETLSRLHTHHKAEISSAAVRLSMIHTRLTESLPQYFHMELQRDLKASAAKLANAVGDVRAPDRRSKERTKGENRMLHFFFLKTPLVKSASIQREIAHASTK